VVGKTIQLGSRSATVIGVLEPSVPYPADTEIIANMVTSPHHMGAQMITMRTHRMTRLFGRLKAGATIDEARSELSAIHEAIKSENAEAYPVRADMRIDVAALRDQIAAPARPVLLILLAAAAVVFIIACSNVANLILARSVRREGELAVRAALGASRGALRRTLLAESLVLCGAGAVLGILLARPMVAIVSSFAARFSVRALEVSVDSSLLWVGATLAMVAAVLLAYVPRLPSAQSPAGNGLAAGSVRITPGTNRRLKIFATTQVAFSFVLLAGAAMLLATLIALRSVNTGYEMQQVLAIDLPMQRLAQATDEEFAFYRQLTEKIAGLPGVDGVSMGSFTPWRDAG
jgi:cell division protein FtsX